MGYKLSTIGGFEVITFERLIAPIILQQSNELVFQGVVKTPDFGIIKIFWDKNGKCSNSHRKDCNVNILI